MNPNFREESDYLGGVDYDKLSEIAKFTTLTLTTNQVSANGNEQFAASEDESIADTVDIYPEDEPIIKAGRIISIKINVSSGSTDSTVTLYQSPDYNDINQVTSISSLDVSGTPQTYMLGSGLGTPYINKEGESQVYLEINEQSNNASNYEIELYWLDISR